MADDGEASSSSVSKGMFDVFLNFRGPDTGKDFTDHLYYRLVKIKNLRVFRDVPGVEPGKEILPSLMDAIKRSWIFIVVMSSDYLASRSCLEELEEMLKYSGEKGIKRLVYPIFYHVNPAELRRQNSPEAQKAMEGHERHVGVEKVEAWKKAVRTVSWLRGKHILKNKEYESEVIGEIVEKEVLPKHQEIKELLSRFDSEFDAVVSLLNLESRDTLRMVGTYKEDVKIDITMFAFELYYKIKYGFQAASFLVDVSKQLWENTANGLENLKKELLSDMDVEVSTKQRLKYRRVLVVLEGVDCKEHLELLLGELGIRDWFAPENGSRIIITTENKNLFQDYSPVMNGAEFETRCIREDEFDPNRGSFTMMEENVVGLEEDFHKVIKQLEDDDSPGNVVSIVGMPGLGKTTLAQKVYYSKDAKKLFPYRAWVTLSKEPILIQVLEELLDYLKVPYSKYENSSDEKKKALQEKMLKDKVKECLKGKKYLVVLDDVWDSDALRSCFPNDKNGSKILVTTSDALRSCFPNDKNGSKILVTTRNDQVANAFESKIPHLTVTPMNEKESWELFRNEVFYSTTCPPELELIGKSIAESCKGIPLVIKARAGIVKKRQRSEEAWNYFKDRLLSFSIAEYKEGKKVMDVFMPSYDDLLPEMKLCFLYLGAFPEDEEILVRDLICMWIAEDFIKPRIQTRRSKVASAIEPEDDGEECLKKLVERNMVQVVKRRIDGKGVKTVKIHDVFRDLCIFVSDNLSDSNNAPRLSFPTSDVGMGSYACLVTCNQSSTCSLFAYGDVQRCFHSVPKDCQVNVLYLKGVYASRDETRAKAELKKLVESYRYLNTRVAFLQHGSFKLQTPEELDVLYTWKREETSIDEILKHLRYLRYHSGNHFLQGAEGVEDKMQNVQTLLYVYADSRIGFLLDNDYFANLTTFGLVISAAEAQSIEKNLKSLDCLSKLSKLKLKFGRVGTFISIGKIAFPSRLP